MKILKYLLFLILIGLIGFAIFIAIQPSTYDISRSQEIAAPAPVVHSYIDDYAKWGEWSPWLEKEPEAVVTLGEKTVGVGAFYSWKGDELGEGNMETTYVSKDSINQTINFKSPYESTSEVYWTINAGEGSTNVTWGMKGNLGFMEKVFITLGGGMEKAIGPDYERGLEKMDSVVTNGMKKYTITDNKVADHGGGYYLYISTSSKIDETDDKMEMLFPRIMAFMGENKIEAAGMPFSRYTKWDEEAGTTIFSTCIPVKEKIVTPAGSEVLCGYIEPGKHYKTTLTGNYTNLAEAWTKTMENIKAAGLEEVEGGEPFEVYANDPGEYPNPADWITEIYIPVKE